MSIDVFAGAHHFCLSWTRQIQVLPHFCFLKTHFDILPSRPRSSKLSLFLDFPHQTPIFTSPSPHTCHTPHPTQSPWFDQLDTVWWRVQFMQFLLTLSPLPCYLVRRRPYSRTPSAYVLPQCKRPSLRTIQNNRKCNSSVFLIFTFLDIKLFRMIAGIIWDQCDHNFFTNTILMC